MTALLTASPPTTTPNSWYAFHGHLVNYQWVGGFVAGEEIVKEAQFFIDSGLYAAGYSRMNFDDCIVIGRNETTNELIPDPLAFPAGPADVSAKLKALGFSMGWYTVRNNKTCASGPPPRLMRPGSNGFEALDARTWASWGVDYLCASARRGDAPISTLTRPPPRPAAGRTTRAATPKSPTPCSATHSMRRGGPSSSRSASPGRARSRRPRAAAWAMGGASTRTMAGSGARSSTM